MKNTLISSKPIISILLILSLVISMAAIVLPSKEAKADATSITITSPTTASPLGIKAGGSLSVTYTLPGITPVDATVSFEVYLGSSPTTTIHLPNSFVHSGGGGPYTDIIGIKVDAAAGTYDIKATATTSGSPVTNIQTSAVVVDNTAPTVTLVTPSASGIYLKGATLYTNYITWTAIDNNAGSLLITIDYTIDGGATWTNIVTDGPYAQGTQQRNWTTPAATDSGTCKIRVKAKDVATNESSFVQSTNSFAIITAVPIVAVTAPNGGELWNGGSAQSITFTTASPYSPTLDYYIELSVNSGGAWTVVIQDWLLNQAKGDIVYPWTVTNSVRNSTSRVRVTARDLAGNTNNDASNADFTIKDVTLPAITITAPTTGVTWYAGTSRDITFNVSDNVPGALAAINLFYSTDGGSAWTPITYGGTLAQGAKTQAWTIPSVASTNCKIKVTATDGASPANIGEAQSGTFTIQTPCTPVVAVTAPIGGETWQTGSTQSITWTASCAADPSSLFTYKIYLSQDSGGTWGTAIVLPSQSQGSRSYSYSVPDLSGVVSTCRIKVTAEVAGGTPIAATSAADFTITNVGVYPVTTATISLVYDAGTGNGWNLVSLPLIPTNTSIESVLSTCISNVVSVWYYSGGASGTWSSYAPGAPSSLTTMTDGKAYWINVSANCSITFQGRKGPVPPNSPPTYSYVAGWNMVGYKSTLGHTVIEYLGAATHVAPITSYNNTTKAYGTVVDAAAMTTGGGYWVYFNGSGPWNVAPPSD